LYKKAAPDQVLDRLFAFEGIQKKFRLKANGMTNKTPKGNFLSFSGVCFQ
jgi:hypothetical protein